MTKKHDRKPAGTARLQVKKEVLRNLATDDLAAVAGGLSERPGTTGGPCPYSKQER
ncbi:MAG TPA: hypothetical protein VMZ28_06015 [Kofleriaceae bacterium]|nr:hypothetical protein [Kofleriaceae bacterium]